MTLQPVFRKFLFILLGIAVAVSIATVVIEYSSRDRMFHGQLESQWIAGLKYHDDDQNKEWRGFGSEGVDVLVRALKKQNGISTRQRFYNRFYYSASRIGLGRVLPAAKTDPTHGTRMCLVSLLGNLRTNTISAVPVMIQTARDEDRGVRLSAIAFFSGNEDETAPLNRMTPSDKRKLLPILLENMNDSDGSIRNNTVLLFRYYPEEVATVSPVLTNALYDSKLEVRFLAADALNKIAPEEIVPSGAVQILINLAKEPNDQVAYRALQILGEIGKEPTKVVPILAENVQSTNALLAHTAIHAIIQFKDSASEIIPVLEKVSQRKDGVGSHAADALKKMKSATVAKTN